MRALDHSTAPDPESVTALLVTALLGGRRGGVAGESLAERIGAEAAVRLRDRGGELLGECLDRVLGAERERRLAPLDALGIGHEPQSALIAALSVVEKVREVRPAVIPRPESVAVPVPAIAPSPVAAARRPRGVRRRRYRRTRSGAGRRRGGPRGRPRPSRRDRRRGERVSTAATEHQDHPGSASDTPEGLGGHVPAPEHPAPETLRPTPWARPPPMARPGAGHRRRRVGLPPGRRGADTRCRAGARPGRRDHAPDRPAPGTYGAHSAGRREPPSRKGLSLSGPGQSPPRRTPEPPPKTPPPLSTRAVPMSGRTLSARRSTTG